MARSGDDAHIYGQQITLGIYHHAAHAPTFVNRTVTELINISQHYKKNRQLRHP